MNRLYSHLTYYLPISPANLKHDNNTENRTGGGHHPDVGRVHPFPRGQALYGAEHGAVA